MTLWQDACDVVSHHPPWKSHMPRSLSSTLKKYLSMLKVKARKSNTSSQVPSVFQMVVVCNQGILTSLEYSLIDMASACRSFVQYLWAMKQQQDLHIVNEVEVMEEEMKDLAGLCLHPHPIVIVTTVPVGRSVFVKINACWYWRSLSRRHLHAWYTLLHVVTSQYWLKYLWLKLSSYFASSV